MPAEALMALAGAGATALIGAMATDAWQGARGGIVRLFGRDNQGRGAVVAAQLDEDAALVGRADPAEEDHVREDLVPVWRRRLVVLLEEQPEAEEDLRGLVERVRGGLPDERRTWVQHNTARDNGTLFAVQGGSLHYHRAPGDGPSAPPRPERGEPEEGTERA
ncbi:hypothetical protein [Streptomyces sp. WAC05374]|uniref:hypothetical protein n=1 Tax=Streptomyces sp. WAC05374 TaxID=2487420 RepID=UPI00163BA449|nr:hypothetical protein [Streptomyces sp. WAC05374]